MDQETNTPMLDVHYEESPEKDPLKKDHEDNKTEWYKQLIYSFKYLSVEPTMLLFAISSILSAIATQNLILEKACRVNLNYSEEICTMLKNQNVEGQNEFEREVQKLAAAALSWKTYVVSTVPCFVSMFVGSWSDRTGHRKIFIIICLSGQILMNVNDLGNTYFLKELNVEVLAFSEAIIESLSGGWCICLLVSFSHICAITSVKERTFRLGAVAFCATVGYPCGMGLSGIVLKNFGYFGCYGMCTCLCMINLLYSIFYMRDAPRSTLQKSHDRGGVRHFCRTFFDLTNIKETFRVILKYRPNKKRLWLCVMLAVTFIMFGPQYGEMSIMYMSSRYRFNWDEVQFSIFQTFNSITHTIGTLFSISVFSKLWQWHDSTLGIISTISKIAGSVMYCFAANDVFFYFAPVIEILSGASLLTLRSIVSKLVSPDELGKINSIVSLLENTTPLVYVPMYTKVYTATMLELPGIAFFLGASLTLPVVGVFVWMQYEYRKEQKLSKLKTASGAALAL